MARAKRQSDEIYNARRRFKRAAARYEKRAAGLTGASKSMMQKLAKQALDKANALYQKPLSALPETKRVSRIKQLSEQSLRMLESARNKPDSAERREQEARELLSGSVGSKIYGGLVNIWKTPADDKMPVEIRQDYQVRNDAIMRFFGVTSMWDAIKKIEQIVGNALYSTSDEVVRYDEVVTSIQAYVERMRHGY